MFVSNLALAVDRDIHLEFTAPSASLLIVALIEGQEVKRRLSE